MFQQRKSTNNAAKVIFNASDVATRLAGLKEAARLAGKEDGAWWAPALKIDWAGIRPGGKGTQWASILFTDAAGVSGRLSRLRINGERHIGQIMPASAAGVAELSAQNKNPNVKIEQRTRKPTITIQKWAAQVKTNEDGITPLMDADGQPILPGDEMLSDYYMAASLINEAFTTEVKERIDRGMALLMKAAEMKRADKAVTAQAVEEAFVAANGPRCSRDMILSSDSIGTIRKLFPTQKDTDLLTKTAIVSTNVKIVALVQEYISDQAKKNAGLLLPNPMTRMTMEFDPAPNAAATAFFDKSKPYLAEGGKPRYDIGKVNGELINNDNVHYVIKSRTTIDGIVNMDVVCFSNMGISIPVKIEAVVYEEPPAFRETLSVDDVYESLGVNENYAFAAPQSREAPAAPAEGSAQPLGGAQPKSAPPAVVENYDDLLGELGGDQIA